uniref:Uncharacterized protein n=1 Tax=Glossina brevipalpis TaxID=37001 RepID=A0A1A9WQJ3_9MUSC
MLAPEGVIETAAPRPVGPSNTTNISQTILTRPSTPTMHLPGEIRPNVEALAQRLDVHYEGYDDVEVEFGYSKAFLEKQLGIRISLPREEEEVPEAPVCICFMLISY